MNFVSDNESGICPEILEALIGAASGFEPSYGADGYTSRLDGVFSNFFEFPVEVFPVVTGTAANVMALSSLVHAGGGVLCHRNAHIATSEGGAPEFYLNGGKLGLLDGDDGLIDPATFSADIEARAWGNVHQVQHGALSLTQATETGRVYTLDQITELAAIAKSRDLPVHMDGARFANAIVSLRCTPAEMTWKAGIDALSFGATKNGAMGAEAVVYFDAALSERAAHVRKRGGHLLSKMRFVSAQLEAYVTTGVWERNARHANAMARRLAAGLKPIEGVEVDYGVDANLVFATLSSKVLVAWQAEGIRVASREHTGPNRVRLVTSWSTTESDVDDAIRIASSMTSPMI